MIVKVSSGEACGHNVETNMGNGGGPGAVGAQKHASLLSAPQPQPRSSSSSF